MSEATSAGTLLGGRVSYVQPARGHRSGIEPVLLAAFVPARPGDAVLEGGTGAGAGLLCLACRVPGVTGVGVEADPALVAIAAANFAANGFGCRAVRGTLPALPDGVETVAHAFANPPWHDPAGTPAPDPGRRLARQRGQGLIAGWAAGLGGAVERGGTLSMIVSAAVWGETAAGFEAAGFGGVTLFPLWPRAGEAAKLVMLQGTRGSRAPARVLAGLVLHAAAGGFTAEAEEVLRSSSSLG